MISGERDGAGLGERVADRGELHRRTQLRLVDHDVVVER